MARLEGVEPPAYGLEVRCSIQLSYRRTCMVLWLNQPGSNYHSGRPMSTKTKVMPIAILSTERSEVL